MTSHVRIATCAALWLAACGKVEPSGLVSDTWSPSASEQSETRRASSSPVATDPSSEAGTTTGEVTGVTFPGTTTMPPGTSRRTTGQADAAGGSDASPDAFRGRPDSGTDARPSCTAASDTSHDPENCGRCSHSCEGGTCSAGVCQPVLLTTGPAGTRGLAVDAVNVYWATTTSVMAVPKNGGPAVTLVADAGSNPWGVAVDATYLYWVNNAASNDGGALLRYPLGGGAVTTLAAALDSANYIALDATNVYFSLHVVGQIGSVPIAGGSASALYTGQSGSNFITVDSTNVYWTTTAGNAWQCQKAKCSATGVETARVNGGYAAGVAVTGGDVYTAFSDTGTLEKWSIGGGHTTTLASGMSNPIAVVADGSGVYWFTSEPNGAVFRIGLDGGTVTTLASQQDSPYVGLALDSAAVYWANSGDGTIMKVAKP